VSMIDSLSLYMTRKVLEAFEFLKTKFRETRDDVLKLHDRVFASPEERQRNAVQRHAARQVADAVGQSRVDRTMAVLEETAKRLRETNPNHPSFLDEWRNSFDKAKADMLAQAARDPAKVRDEAQRMRDRTSAEARLAEMMAKREAAAGAGNTDLPERVGAEVAEALAQQAAKEREWRLEKERQPLIEAMKQQQIDAINARATPSLPELQMSRTGTGVAEVARERMAARDEQWRQNQLRKVTEGVERLNNIAQGIQGIFEIFQGSPTLTIGVQ
jgi:hypothetical protein